jgi:hypothetical protein
LALGCAPEFAVVPQNGMDRVVAQVNGVTLVAFANQWDANPYDLTDYVTPIAVELYNPGPNEVRVSYADLVLKDGSGFRFGAINPFLPAQMGEAETTDRAPLVDVAPAQKPVLLASNGPILLASGRFGGGGGGRVSAPPAHFGGGARMVAPPSGRMIGPGPGLGHPILAPPGVRGGMYIGPSVRHWGYGGRGWNGYLVAGGLRPYYGFGVGYWGGPWWAFGPYYSAWVYPWGPDYYPARPTTDVLTLGLPEGVLPPGAHVSGFLYFKRATAAQRGGLDLSWDMHDARTGASLGTLHVPLAVVPR